MHLLNKYHSYNGNLKYTPSLKRNIKHYSTSLDSQLVNYLSMLKIEYISDQLVVKA